jgi:phosphoribosylformylglycinamidine synthase
MFLARVFITLKSTVNDPEGQTIRSGLQDMGYGSVASVRAGKYMEVSLDDEDEGDATAQIESMCDRLLANPVIEEYRYELTRVE